MNIENLRELDLDREAMADLFGVLARETGIEIAIEAIGLENILQTVELDKLEEFVKKAKRKNNQQMEVS